MGSFSDSFSSGSFSVLAQSQSILATPGYLYEMWRKYRGKEKEEETFPQEDIQPVFAQTPRVDYEKKIKSLKLQIHGIKFESNAIQSRIDEIERENTEKLKAQIAAELMLAQKTIVMLAEKEAALLEEIEAMEVMDVSYFALLAIRNRLTAAAVPA